MKIVFLFFICQLISKEIDFLANKKNVNRFFLINNCLAVASLATLLSNHSYTKYLRAGLGVFLPF